MDGVMESPCIAWVIRRAFDQFKTEDIFCEACFFSMNAHWHVFECNNKISSIGQGDKGKNNAMVPA